jgi:hypothetical protein
MFKKLFCLSVLLTCFPWGASADVVTYAVTVDTSSISSDVGSLDFQFNPGPFTTQAANLQILGFASNGTLDPLALGPQLAGDVTGTLPGALTFDNGGAFNDYFTDFTFGSSLSFLVSLYGPALTAPDGVSTSGSAFAFSMFSDPAGTMPALTSDPNGFAFTTGVNLDGTTTPANSSGAPLSYSVQSVPEPGSLLLLVSGLAGLAWSARRKRGHCVSPAETD